MPDQLSERDELERQIGDLRDFEREYRSRLIAYHRDCLAELTTGEAGTEPGIRRQVSRITRLAKAGDGPAARGEERHLYHRVLGQVAAGAASSAELATAALAAAQIGYPEAPGE